MSELQTALLLIGIGVIIAVYVFGWWQQRQYRRKFGGTLKNEQPDALYQAPSQHFVEHTHQPIFNDVVEDKSHITSEPPYEPILQPEPVNIAQNEVAHTSPEPIHKHDDSHGLLNAYTDFIVEIRPAEPSHANVLSGLWQRKFDFGKPVLVFGQVLDSQRWERVLAESHGLYSCFHIALQMVDRGGPIGIAKLADFRDLLIGLAQKIRSDVKTPDIQQSHDYAVELDRYCVTVDQVVGINLIPPGDRTLSGKRIANAAAALGMTLESDGAFHLLDGHGHSLFSMVNKNNEAFQHYSIDNCTCEGLTMLLDVPRTERPSDHFERMVQAAHSLAKELQVNIVDDHLVILNDSSLQHIFDQICDIEDTMLQSSMIPGSPQARRLFV